MCIRDRYAELLAQVFPLSRRYSVMLSMNIRNHVIPVSYTHLDVYKRQGYVFVGEKVVCEAEFMAQIVKNK